VAIGLAEIFYSLRDTEFQHGKSPNSATTNANGARKDEGPEKVKVFSKFPSRKNYLLISLALPFSFSNYLEVFYHSSMSKQV